MKNEHLIPDVILGTVLQLKTSTLENERLSAEARLIAIRDYIDAELKIAEALRRNTLARMKTQ